ncbi:MAG: hypothetical protein WD795_17620 [Woeseia sp.]
MLSSVSSWHAIKVTAPRAQRIVQAHLAHDRNRRTADDGMLSALPDLSETADPYFMASYASVLLTPRCRPESVAILQAAIEIAPPQVASASVTAR